MAVDRAGRVSQGAWSKPLEPAAVKGCASDPSADPIRSGDDPPEVVPKTNRRRSARNPATDCVISLSALNGVAGTHAPPDAETR
jgi:hypothetical protein